MNTLEDELFEAVEIMDYDKGFGQYFNAQCIYIQILAEIVYNGGDR